MNRIIGIKLTHDAAVAAIAEDGSLLFSVELEKIENRPRYAAALSLAQVEDVLAAEGVELDDEDVLVVDGWKHGAIRAPIGLRVAPYHDADEWCTNLCQLFATSLPLQGLARRAFSTPHVAGHVIGSYALSPFAARDEIAHALVWDGGISPRIYAIDPDAPGEARVRFLRELCPLYGTIYGIAGYYFGPYRRADVVAMSEEELLARGPFFGGRDVPGKLMSWIAKGRMDIGAMFELDEVANAELYAHLAEPEALRLSYRQDGAREHRFMRAVAGIAKRRNMSDEDALATVHAWLEGMLVEETVRATPRGCNLIFTGGSALNIKWNSALRASGHFASVFVPPCPNDSGSALGAAAAVHWLSRGGAPVKWSVYSGPEVGAPPEPEWLSEQRWGVDPCPVDRLAEHLAARPGEPIVVIHGRAEIGPRALGHRSIFMNPSARDAQAILNRMKRREAWRPVAPICLEEDAPRFFSPGTRDPWMLFDHEVRPGHREDLRAITHIDHTARLQTVGPDGSPMVSELLIKFAKHSGRPPILCNTSANFNGSGFFPDVKSAIKWGEVNFVWSHNALYYRWFPREVRA